VSPDCDSPPSDHPPLRSEALARLWPGGRRAQDQFSTTDPRTACQPLATIFPGAMDQPLLSEVPIATSDKRRDSETSAAEKEISKGGLFSEAWIGSSGRTRIRRPYWQHLRLLILLQYPQRFWTKMATLDNEFVTCNRF